jgi:hypothetical protein
MKNIRGESTDDATLNQLASDLSGISTEYASKNEAAQLRFAKAQATVQSCAAVISATMGKIEKAKELAQSAKTIEDMYVTNSVGTTARRALVYVTLRENNPSTALSTLLS